ncbi:(2Fe-2S)-binding protein [Mycobacterium sp. URHD0025]|uniref:(2Fe-2S)-binding protein n=1 Tax=Mycobacterium sp. URHD0025 TaxID=1298864 RepID=UPI00048E4AE3|nr:(2Fe-2S)-binding protein [Mycobacterium sp. URHD0025]
MDVPGFRSLAQLGEFFVLPAAADASWMPISSLLSDAAAIRDFAYLTRAAIASSMGIDPTEVSIKAAASSVHLSIAARLLSPVVGAAVCQHAVPLLVADSVYWQRDSSHRPRLGVTRLDWVAVNSSEHAASLITDSLVGDVLRPLSEIMRSATGVSPQVLWGNIASAANGAVTVLSMSRPHDERRGRALIASLLAVRPLSGAAEFVDGRFMRRNCCLYYRIPGGGYCGDCVLASAPG